MSKTDWKVVDHGKAMISVEDMRLVFEMVCQNTPRFKNAFDLTPNKTKGEFDGYKDETTNTFWCGFAIGMRCMASRKKGGTL